MKDVVVPKFKVSIGTCVVFLFFVGALINCFIETIIYSNSMLVFLFVIPVHAFWSFACLFCDIKDYLNGWR